MKKRVQAGRSWRTSMIRVICDREKGNVCKTVVTSAVLYDLEVVEITKN